MFGLFAKRPPREEQIILAKSAGAADELSMHLIQHRSFLPRSDKPRPDLDDEADRQEIVDAIIGKIEMLDLESAPENAKTGILGAHLEDIMRDPNLPVVEDDAGFALYIMNGINVMYRRYRELYPKYRPLYEMLNQLAKIVPGGFRVVFGDDLPPQVRKAFPHFSIMFEENRANSFI